VKTPRPIHRHVVKRVNDYRVPLDGPLTPRLRIAESIRAIGFHHHFSEQGDEAESSRRD